MKKHAFSTAMVFAVALCVALAVRIALSGPRDALPPDRSADGSSMDGHEPVADEHAGHDGSYQAESAPAAADDHGDNTDAADHADPAEHGDGRVGDDNPSEPPAAGGAVPVGNETCVVMHGEVTGEPFEFNGWLIGQCCGLCEAMFNDDTDRYAPLLLEQTGIDVRVAPHDDH